MRSCNVLVLMSFLVQLQANELALHTVNATNLVASTKEQRMHIINKIIGIIGTGIGASALIPQVIKTARTRSARDLSYAWMVTNFLGGLAARYYAICAGLWPMYIPGLIYQTLQLVLLIMKVIFDRTETRKPTTDGRRLSATQDESHSPCCSLDKLVDKVVDKLVKLPHDLLTSSRNGRLACPYRTPRGLVMPSTERFVEEHRQLVGMPEFPDEASRLVSSVDMKRSGNFDVVRLFSSLDIRNQGYLDADSLQQALRAIAPRIPEALVHELYAELTRGAGTVTLSEFERFIHHMLDKQEERRNRR